MPGTGGLAGRVCPDRRAGHDAPVTRGTPEPDDLFWRTFRAAHPEADLVLLPDPALTARPSELETIGPEEAAQAAEQVAVVADQLLDELDDRLAGRPGWPVVAPRTRLWRRDALRRRYLECRLVVGDLTDDQPVPLLRAVGNAFLAAGWLARPLPDEPPRLVARRGPFRATAAATPDSLQLLLHSGLLPAEEAPR